MSDTATQGQPFYGPPTTLAVRMPEDLRTHLDVLAKLNERSTTEECRVALETWVLNAKSDPKVMARAQQVQDKIERDAQAQRDAITSILGKPNGKASPTPKAAPAGPEK